MKRLMICLVLALPACTPTELPLVRNTAPAIPSVEDNTCGARQYTRVVGQNVTVLEKIAILRPVRVIRPDSAVTLDYNPTRLNVILDTDEHITRLKCG